MHAARSTLTFAATAALAGLSALILAATVVAAPLVDGADEPPSITDRDTLVIGVNDDRPGLALKAPDGSLKGFDIDVATYVAGQLDVAPKDLTFKPLASNERESALRRGTVDMVIATYSITPERKDKVTFAGPYYVAHQDILVRQGDRTIKGVRDLRGKKLCQVSGSNSWRRVTEERRVLAELVSAGSYAECVKSLTAGRLDAVSTDDLILAGYAALPRSGVTVVNAPFSDERYGIGLRKGDVSGCREVNRILTGMYQNGAAETLLDQWFATSGLNIAITVPQFEGCT
ncbi:glutamate ABC transporter substrate-binding protein [Actinomadura sp. NAK00032]|uniref:glutamate ABC transporter substrate-binding protein n=1 Tax=Actinomadura sp. NAK00032 TaxID=2742128 RepID=UPI0015915543|nr:glutamate ABC transporter substrate-binding protein [Actinomadura sp. NAK00032]QKW33806.1 glutamate ABC transporter substrate-binding protein [Actinomadura sp. NAK00032]